MHIVTTIYETATGRVISEGLLEELPSGLDEGLAAIQSEVEDIAETGAEVAWVLDGVRAVLADSAEARTARDAALLPEIKDQALAEIDHTAEIWRGLILTPGVGQMATYEHKEAQARAWVAAVAGGGSPDIDAPEYCYLKAEIGITGEDGGTVAVVIIAMADAWHGYGAAIEAVRLAAKAAVDAAADADGVQAVLDGLIWPEVPA